ncbi:MAG TPA: TauD/TfdA family dioxygenase [bacterium]|nr:TauD/TfdA family dioxygenase [bacterium]
MGSQSIEVRRVAGAVGAEIGGIDLARDLDDGVVTTLRQALLEHLVLFFRDQALTPPQFLDVARCFGDPNEYPFVRGLEGYPTIIEVAKLEHETVNFGGVWHSDTTYLERPPMATLLLAREVPPHGGDTIFANQYLAYETLSPGMQRLLEGLVAINSSAKADASRTREDRIRDHGRAPEREVYVSEHPAVRTHPETGRKALYVNVAHTVRFKDMTEAESEPILRFLFQHQVRPELTCRFSWRPGSLAFWDNRAVQHNAVNDYAGFRRIMNRITLAGDTPS